jgi:hypothetical protein
VTFGKPTADFGIDVDQRRDKVAALVAKHHDVANEGRGSQAVFDELRRKRLAGAKLAQILEPVEENELPALVETHRVAGAKSVLGATELGSRCFVLEIAREGAAAHTKLSVCIDPGLDRLGDGRIAWQQFAHRGGIEAAAAMRGKNAKFSAAIDVAQRYAKRVEKPEQIRRQPGSAAKHRSGLGQTQNVADRPNTSRSAIGSANRRCTKLAPDSRAAVLVLTAQP